MNDSAKGNPPNFTAYTVRNYGGGEQPDASWTKIGVAWIHKDASGFDVRLDALPIDGRIVLRMNETKRKSGG
jgi:hypothetical protein